MNAPGGSSLLMRAGAVLMVLGALVLIVDAIGPWSNDGSSDDPSTLESSPGSAAPAPTTGPTPGDATSTGDTTATPGVEPEGFTTITARITDVDGEVCEVCLWLADDGDERGRGLMGVTDLGEPLGMVFRFDDERLGSFFMFQTPTPLSIAWFSADGNFVGAADMEPCLDLPSGDCPLYSPDSAYDVAIEVFEGDLESIGIGPGSTVSLIDGSESARCALTP